MRDRSSAAASSSTRSSLSRADVRRAVAEELVNILEEGGNNFAKIIIGVAHDRVVDAVEVSLNDNKLRNVASDAVASVYEVFVNDAPSATIDIQPFADSAFSAIRSVDPSILQILSPQVDPLEISRDERDPDVGRNYRRGARCYMGAIVRRFSAVGNFVVNECRRQMAPSSTNGDSVSILG